MARRALASAAVLALGHACPYLASQGRPPAMGEPSAAERPRDDNADTACLLSVRKAGRSQPGVPGGCGSKFCYGRFLPLGAHPAFELPFGALVGFGTPNSDPQQFNYMEDSQARSNELDGFPLNDERPGAGAAGYTYLGQLLSHDINLDESSVLGVPVDPATLPNSNTPQVDLDTLYGMGIAGGGRANLRRGRFELVAGGVQAHQEPRDFPRAGHGHDHGHDDEDDDDEEDEEDEEGGDGQGDEDDDVDPDDHATAGAGTARKEGTAKIADLRNDEHRIIAQLTAAFMKLHNVFYDAAAGAGLKKKGAFEQARAQTIKTWQAVVLTDLLPALLDSATLERVRDPSLRVLFKGALREKLAMPVEFSTAAYRLFHSRARGRYRLNNLTDGTNGPRARLFDVGNDEPNLLGGSPLTDLFYIQWSRFFGPGAEKARITDMLYSRPMLRLPVAEAGLPPAPIQIQCPKKDAGCAPIAVNGTQVCSFAGGECGLVAPLAILDLSRGQTHRLPGGRQLATHVREALGATDVEVLSVGFMAEQNVFGLPEDYVANYGDTDVPLLFYLAHESIKEQGGRGLGSLGSRIVAETLYGLIEDTKPSVLSGGVIVEVSPITGKEEVSMQDVLQYIGWWS